MKILIIEDEEALVRALKKGLSKHGYIVDYALDGEEGLELYYINSYDLIILDLNLPSMDGIDILETIRKEDKEQRILILSARSSVEDRVKGLDLGANDYLIKPFDFLELDARVRSILRTRLIQEDTILREGNLELDSLKKQVVLSANILDLAPREYSILEYLMVNKGQVVSTERLIEHVWDSEVNIFTDSVKVHISTLRKKLRALDQGEYIHTLRGQGYMLAYKEVKNED